MTSYEDYKRYVEGVSLHTEDSPEFHQAYLQGGLSESTLVENCHKTLLTAHGLCYSGAGPTYTVPNNVTIFFFTPANTKVSPDIVCKFLRHDNQEYLFNNTLHSYFYSSDNIVDESFTNFTKLRHDAVNANMKFWELRKRPTLLDLKVGFGKFVSTNGKELIVDCDDNIQANPHASIAGPGTQIFNYMFNFNVFDIKLDYKSQKLTQAIPSMELLDLPCSTPSNSPELTALLENNTHSINSCWTQLIKQYMTQTYVWRFRKRIEKLNSIPTRKTNNHFRDPKNLTSYNDFYLSELVERLQQELRNQNQGDKPLLLFVAACRGQELTIEPERMLAPNQEFVIVQEGSKEYTEMLDRQTKKRKIEE